MHVRQKCSRLWQQRQSFHKSFYATDAQNSVQILHLQHLLQHFARLLLVRLRQQRNMLRFDCKDCDSHIKSDSHAKVQSAKKAARWAPATTSPSVLMSPRTAKSLPARASRGRGGFKVRREGRTRAQQHPLKKLRKSHQPSLPEICC